MYIWAQSLEKSSFLCIVFKEFSRRFVQKKSICGGERMARTCSVVSLSENGCQRRISNPREEIMLIKRIPWVLVSCRVLYVTEVLHRKCKTTKLWKILEFHISRNNEKYVTSLGEFCCRSGFFTQVCTNENIDGAKRLTTVFIFLNCKKLSIRPGEQASAGSIKTNKALMKKTRLDRKKSIKNATRKY